VLYATGPLGLCKWQGAQGQHALCKKEEQSRMQPTQKPMVHTHLDQHVGAVCRRLPRYVDEQATGTHVGRCRRSKRDRSLHGTTMVGPCGQREGRDQAGRSQLVSLSLTNGSAALCQTRSGHLETHDGSYVDCSVWPQLRQCIQGARKQWAIMRDVTLPIWRMRQRCSTHQSHAYPKALRINVPRNRLAQQCGWRRRRRLWRRR
jgi:hypothetical protein